MTDQLARVAYKAYGQVTDFKNFRGEPMPEFDQLPETIQKAWVEASKAAVVKAEKIVMSARFNADQLRHGDRVRIEGFAGMTGEIGNINAFALHHTTKPFEGVGAYVFGDDFGVWVPLENLKRVDPLERLGLA